MQVLIQTLKNDFNDSLCNSAPVEEKEIILQYARFGRLITKIFVCCVYCFHIIMVLAPIFAPVNDPVRAKRYPLCAWYYWDQNSDVVYVLAYFFQVRI